MNRRILSIDAIRLGAALLVVSIHCWIYEGRSIVVPFARIAVPLYYLISGFFLYSPEERISREKISKNLKKISWIWLVGTVAFCIDFIFKCKIKGDFSAFIPSWQTPILWMVFCHQKIGFPLWFLIAFVEGLFVLSVLLKNQKQDKIPRFWQWSIPCLILTFGVILNKYLCSIHPIMGNKDLQYPPVLFMSCPYLFLGYLFGKEYDILVEYFNNKQSLLVLLIVIFSIGTYIEGHIAPSGGDSYLFTLPLVLPLFVLAILHPYAGGKTLAKLGQKYSLWIYLFHVIIYSCIQRQLGTYKHWLLHPLTIFTLTLLFSIILNYSIIKINKFYNKL